MLYNIKDTPDNYDAIVEIPIRGNGVEHEKFSNVKLVSITPEGNPMSPGRLPMNIIGAHLLQGALCLCSKDFPIPSCVS